MSYLKATVAHHLDLFSVDVGGNEAWEGFLLGDATRGSGAAVLNHGAQLDPARTYFARTVLNRGTGMEVRGERLPLAVLKAELACDSDNNAGTNEDGSHGDPSRNSLEDRVEDLEGHADKVLRPNLLDVDSDKVPGFADGIDVHGNEGDSASAPFVPLLLEIDGNINPAKARIRLVYSASRRHRGQGYTLTK